MSMHATVVPTQGSYRRFPANDQATRFVYVKAHNSKAHEEDDGATLFVANSSHASPGE